MSISFEHLIHPISLEEFRREYADRRSLKLLRGAPGHYDALFRGIDLERLLDSVTIPPSEFELMCDGEPLDQQVFTRMHTLRKGDQEPAIDVNALFERYAQGATLYLDRLDRYDDRVGDLCRVLDGLFKCRLLKASILATPRGSRGFDVHFDTHDVFVLQLEGRKQWRLFESTVPLAAYFQEYRMNGPAPQGLREAFVLGPGDFLYMPRGLVHEARAVDDGPSLHISISLAVHTGCDLLEQMLEEARQCTPALDREIPLSLRTAANSEALFRESAPLLDATFSMDMAERTRKRLIRNHAFTRPPRKHRALSSIDALHDGCRLRLNPADGQMVHVQDSDHHSHVWFGGQVVSFPRAARDALTRALCGTPFAIDDLPGLSSTEARDLVERGVRSGLFVAERSHA